MITYPEIDPVIFNIGPLAVRWYSVAYMAGILLGWQYAKFLVKKFNLLITEKQLEEFVTYIIIGIIVGGRLGYVIFYDPIYYFDYPLNILKIYEGGMSFHGGLLGIILASYSYCRKNQIPYLNLTDILAVVTPIGIFFGRLANFINGELYGKITDAPWAMIFPYTDYTPRHPSQLYEAFFEGLALFCLMNYLVMREKGLSRPGFCTGVGLMSYATIRVFIEFFREIDPQVGYLFNYISMGQLLSIPMMISGLYLTYFYKCQDKKSIK